jgi:hypothetical protein
MIWLDLSAWIGGHSRQHPRISTTSLEYFMKSKKLTLILIGGALLGGISSGAFADGKYDGVGSAGQQQLRSPRAQGERVGADYDYPHVPVTTSRSRAEVGAELEQARAQGERVGADYDYPHVAVATSRSRAEVRADAAQNPTLHAVGGNNIYFGG